ncbi:MAG: SDR family NAD(P)-dependent oxidoreductase, partial [Planctomycetota bacterium]|nr:SDR family NAD(P)-dependent oxidoreductase [Planctomycetota bacterium]
MTPRPVAIVTGASRGIGAEAAVEFARRGYDLALTARGADALAEVVKLVRDAGGQALAIPGDLGDLAFAQSVVPQVVARFGRVDALVNNAAWRELVTMRTITPESWEKTIRVCLTSPA